MNVKSLMSPNIISVRPDTMIGDAARIMLAQRVSGLPVLDEKGALVGVVTEGDLLRRSEIQTEGKPPGWWQTFFMPSAAAADYVLTHSRHVSGVMTHNPVFVTPETELDEVAQLMVKKRIKRLPVMEHDKLVGVISRSDLLRALARRLVTTKPPGTDSEILAHIKNEMAHANWAPHSGIRISVKDKVVNLEGAVFSDEERRAVIVIAENAPGVDHVDDHLTFVDPGSGLSFPGPL